MTKKEKITVALKNIDAAISQVRLTRQEHEVLISSFKEIVDMANENFKEEEPKVEN